MRGFKLENAIGYVVTRAALKLRLELHRSFKAHGYNITPEQWAVMNCLWEEEGVSQSVIAERIVKDKTNLTRILDVMERKGLIRRENHESDRRTYRIFLKEKAWNMKDELIAIAEEVNALVKQGLSEKDVRKLMWLMNNINDNLAK